MKCYGHRSSRRRRTERLGETPESHPRWQSPGQAGAPRCTRSRPGLRWRGRQGFSARQPLSARMSCRHANSDTAGQQDDKHPLNCVNLSPAPQSRGAPKVRACPSSSSQPFQHIVYNPQLDLRELLPYELSPRQLCERCKNL